MEYLEGGRRPLWITWEKQVRNRSMSCRLNANFVELQIEGGRLKRYLLCGMKTCQWLWRWRSGVVFVQNPSLVLSLQAVLLRPLFRYHLIVDAHNAGIYPAEGKNAVLQWLANWVIINADLVLVTNDGLATCVTNLGGKPFIMPDPLPEICFNEVAGSRVNGDAFNVLFICTWAADEPYLEVFKAAELLPQVQFFVTGNSKGRERALGRALPPNVNLTGYLPDAEYEHLLLRSDVIVDLTTRADCLVCGAYESVSAGKPFVLSDSEALRAYFRIGGVHVSNQADDIAEGIARVISSYASYCSDVVRLKQLLELEWGERRRELMKIVYSA